MSFRPGSSACQDEAVRAMEVCIADIRGWMASHQLMLNDSKTEFVIIGSRQQLTKVNIDGIQVGATEIKPVKSVRSLGAWFDTTMSMNVHIGKVCSKAFHSLYNIRQIRKFLSDDSTKIHAFVTSHLDYCNSLLYGIPQYQIDRLARITCYVPRYAHITPTLMHLHWLSIRFRVHFKIALLVFKALKGFAPPYLTELLKVKIPGRYALRTNSQLLLEGKTFGDRAFASAAPRIWNDLPLAIRESETVKCFKSRLKTYLFTTAFKCRDTSLSVHPN